MCHVGWLGFWLVGSFLGIHFLISLILIRFNFSDWEVCYGVGSTHSPEFGFTITYWQSRLEIVYPVYFSVLRLVKIRKTLSRKRGMIK